MCDRGGLPLTITDPLGATTRYERDVFGRPVTVTDPTGAVTRLEWTVEGHMARRTAADGSTESWTYDGEGNCATHTDPIGGVSRFEYTHFDLLTARTGPDGVRYEFDHDLELPLTRVTNPTRPDVGLRVRRGRTPHHGDGLRRRGPRCGSWMPPAAGRR